MIAELLKSHCVKSDFRRIFLNCAFQNLISYRALGAGNGPRGSEHPGSAPSQPQG